jgi:hypothetical protein
MTSGRLVSALRIAAVALMLAYSGGAAAQDASGSSAAEPPPETPAPKSAPAPKKKAPASKKVTKPTPRGIYLSPITPVSPLVNVHDKVLLECRVQSELPQAIAARSYDVTMTEGTGAMKLDLRIIDVHAPSGGIFTGPKWITVEGRLIQGKTIKGSFIAKESSMASMSACGMLTKVIAVLADDIVAWLRHPAHDSNLGGAR